MRSETCLILLLRRRRRRRHCIDAKEIAVHCWLVLQVALDG